MSHKLNWKTGFEIELMAPRGRSRRDLAEQIAHKTDGKVISVFHPDSEPAKIPGTEVFENLTPGFKVIDDQENWIASFVDDLTLQADCDRKASPKPGWYRIVSDDNRFIRLIEEQCDASSSLKDVLQPIACLFGTEIEAHPTGMMRVTDKKGRSVAMGARLPGERERPCEIVTAPMERDHHEILDFILNEARNLGFTIPRESATHIHYDASRLRNAHFISRFIVMTHRFASDLKLHQDTNPACVRLGPFPKELVDRVARSDFQALEWADARDILLDAKLTKYCDFNLVNLVNETRDKDTVEIRILPGLMDTDKVIKSAKFFENLIRWCLEDDEPIPQTWDELLKICQKPGITL